MQAAQPVARGHGPPLIAEGTSSAGLILLNPAKKNSLIFLLQNPKKKMTGNGKIQDWTRQQTRCQGDDQLISLR